MRSIREEEEERIGSELREQEFLGWRGSAEQTDGRAVVEQLAGQERADEGRQSEEQHGGAAEKRRGVADEEMLLPRKEIGRRRRGRRRGIGRGSCRWDGWKSPKKGQLMEQVSIFLRERRGGSADERGESGVSERERSCSSRGV